VNKAMISNVLNYPNPFSTSTKFVFTITGSEVPDYMKIQIMTITGKVVKEITKEELGPMYVGTNITQYTWNGRDEYGDLLANGVYFYRVITNLNNKEMEKLQSQTKYLQNSNFDKYFKKGFGKLVILLEKRLD
jgi:flagellar hook assembly protein FlgD